MAMPKRQPVREEQVKGLKYVDKLGKLLARLHDVGTARDKAGNRTLFFDQYCSLVLLFLFNPLVNSLRAIQQASQLKKVQRRLGCARASLGSLSEAVDGFEPERLQEIVQELGRELGPITRDARLAEVKQTVTLADSTVLTALPRIAAAMWRTQRKGEVRHRWALHTEFCLDRSVPERMTLTNGSNRGAAHERAVLKGHLQADRCYVMDRGYFQYTLFNAIRAAASSYVCRVRDTSGFLVTAGGRRGRSRSTGTDPAAARAGSDNLGSSPPPPLSAVPELASVALLPAGGAVGRRAAAVGAVGLKG
jgi:hypothetical protein